MRFPQSLVILVVFLPLLVGCDGCTPKEPSGKITSPDEILKTMVSAYQAAKSYEDQAKVRVGYRLDGKTEEDEGPFAVKLARPNRLSAEVYQLELKCDGAKLHAYIADEATANLDGQVVERPAPAALALADVLADEQVHRALKAGPCREPVQLELLLGEKPLEAFLDHKVAKELLAEEKFDDHMCQRVEIKAQEGPYILWIDTENHVLRRLEYPTEDLRKEIAAQLGRRPEEIDQVHLSAEFLAAKLDGEPRDKDFEFAMPLGAKLVRSFMRPPEPLPSQLFGQRPNEFRFATMEGEKIAQSALDGKLVVLMWFVSDEVSRAALVRLDKVRDEFAAEPGVVFHAINADPAAVTDEQLAKTLQVWGIKTPIARDVEAFGNSSFAVPVAPTLVVLDTAGNVQIFEPGANPRLDTELPGVLKRLQKGDDLAAEIVNQSRQELAAYQRHLSAATASEGSSTQIELPVVAIEPFREPESLHLTALWKCEELKSPGNLRIIEEPGRPPRILVNDGWRGIAELDSAGRVVARHELPEGANVSFLRTAVDGDGHRYYLACAQLGKQLHLFDAEWKLLLSYPAAEQTHDGLRDVRFCDLDGNGQLEICIGFWGSVGVQAIDLKGKRLWSNRIVPTVLSLAETPANDVGFRKLLVTGERGSILRVNQFGNADHEIRVGVRALHHLYRASFSGRRLTAYMGLSYLSDRKVQAVALDEKLEEAWSYPLPEGAFRNQIEYVTSGMLLDAPGWIADVPDGQWVLAGANGSIHMIGDEGDFSDFFQSGESLAGIGCTRIDGAGVLLLSSEKGVTAWRVDRK